MRHSKQIQQVILIALLLLAQQNPAAEAKKPAKKLKALSAPQEPIFDASYLPERSRFDASIKYSRIVFPEDPENVLHGEAKMVDLQAGENRNMLRGGVSQEEKTSLIQTREYGIKPRFSVDLRKMEAKYAPDLARMFYSEIAAARRRAAAKVAKYEPEMQKELKGRLPITDSIPVHKASVDSKPLDAAIAKSQLEQEKARKDKMNPLEAAIDQARRLASGLQQIPNSGGGELKFPRVPVGKPAAIPLPQGGPLAIPEVKGKPLAMPDVHGKPLAMPDVHGKPLAFPEVNAKPLAFPEVTARPLKFPEIPNTNTTVAMKDLEGKLINANKKIPEAELTAEMERAKKRAHDAVKDGQPAMDAILTHLRVTPSISFPKDSTKESTPGDEDSVSIIKWDEWHAKFADLARKPILDAVHNSNNPGGSDTIEIVVKRDHTLSARITTPSNPEFDQAILQAYQSLNGNASLEFPTGSRRNAITFLIDNKHAGGIPTAVKSQTTTGDQERLRK